MTYVITVNNKINDVNEYGGESMSLDNTDI